MFAAGVLLRKYVISPVKNELISLRLCVIFKIVLTSLNCFSLPLPASPFISLSLCLYVCVRERICKAGTFCRPLDSKWQFLVDNVDLFLLLHYFLLFFTSFLAVGVCVPCMLLNLTSYTGKKKKGRKIPKGALQTNIAEEPFLGSPNNLSINSS